MQDLPTTMLSRQDTKLLLPDAIKHIPLSGLSHWVYSSCKVPKQLPALLNSLLSLTYTFLLLSTFMIKFTDFKRVVKF